MTKYEWEYELKKNIHRLPEDEIRRVFEYYGELFDDKIERGGDEQTIIMEFGNPVDVADKILAEYQGLNGEVNGGLANADNYNKDGNITQGSYGAGTTRAEGASASSSNKSSNSSSASYSGAHESSSQPAYAQAKKVSAWRIVTFILLWLVLGTAVIALVVALWAVVVAVFISGVACVIAGAVYIVPTIMLWSSGAYHIVVQLAVCLIAIGAGFLLIFLGGHTTRLGGKLTKISFTAFNRVLGKKRSSYER